MPLRYRLSSALRRARGRFSVSATPTLSSAIGVAPEYGINPCADRVAFETAGALGPPGAALTYQPLAASTHGGGCELDDASIHAEITAFLDFVEARELGRAPWRQGFGGVKAQPSFVLPSGGAGASVQRARGEAALLLETARSEASDVVRRAHGQAERTLEWSRAQGADIVRRSQQIAAERFQSHSSGHHPAEIERR